MRIRRTLQILLATSLMIFGGMSCGSQNKSEDYHFATSGDIVLTQQSHPHGYRQSACFNCHVLANIHREDRVNSGILPVARQLVHDQGLSSCSTCHGSNGLP